MTRCTYILSALLALGATSACRQSDALPDCRVGVDATWNPPTTAIVDDTGATPTSGGVIATGALGPALIVPNNGAALPQGANPTANGGVVNVAPGTMNDQGIAAPANTANGTTANGTTANGTTVNGANPANGGSAGVPINPVYPGGTIVGTYPTLVRPDMGTTGSVNANNPNLGAPRPGQTVGNPYNPNLGAGVPNNPSLGAGNPNSPNLGAGNPGAFAPPPSPGTPAVPGAGNPGVINPNPIGTNPVPTNLYPNNPATNPSNVTAPGAQAPGGVGSPNVGGAGMNGTGGAGLGGGTGGVGGP